MKRILVWGVGFILLIGLFLRFGPLYFGPATYVDGDTVKIGDHKFRLAGIRAPEAGTPTWRDSTDYMRYQILKRGWIVCWNNGEVGSNGLIGTCYKGTTDIAAEMIRAGKACAATKPEYRVERYVKLEEEVGKRPEDCGN